MAKRKGRKRVWAGILCVILLFQTIGFDFVENVRYAEAAVNTGAASINLLDINSTVSSQNLSDYFSTAIVNTSTSGGNLALHADFVMKDSLNYASNGEKLDTLIADMNGNTEEGTTDSTNLALLQKNDTEFSADVAAKLSQDGFTLPTITLPISSSLVQNMSGSGSFVAEKVVNGQDLAVGTYTFESTADPDKTNLVIHFNYMIYAFTSVTAGVSITLQLDADKAASTDTNYSLVWSDDADILFLEESEVPVPETPSPSFEISKSGSYTENRNYIDYTITATGNNCTDAENLIGKEIVDTLPAGMELVSASVEYSGNTIKTYTTDELAAATAAGSLAYTIPSDQSVAAEGTADVVLKVRMQVTGEEYQKLISDKNYSLSVTNLADLYSSDASDQTKVAAQAQDTNTIQISFIDKTGTTDPEDGSLINWTIEGNFNLEKNDGDASAFIIDVLDNDTKVKSQEYYPSNRVRVTGGATAAMEMVDLNSLTASHDGLADLLTSYENMTIEKAMEIKAALGTEYSASKAYYYQREDGTSVMLIPTEDYMNCGTVAFTYTSKNVASVDLSSGTTVSHSNEAKVVWKGYLYPGIGPGTGTAIEPVFNFELKKSAATSNSYFSKTAGNYDPDSQTLSWKFTVNNAGVAISGFYLTDTLPSNTVLTGLTSVKHTKAGSSQAATISSDTAQTPYYTVTGTNPQVVKLYFGDLATDEYYTFTMNTRVEDPGLLGSNHTSGTTVKNSASAYSESDPSVSLQDITDVVSAKITNQIFDKAAASAYHYKTHEVQWKLTVNQNHVPLSAAISGASYAVQDTLPVGMQFDGIDSVKRITADGTTTTVTDTAAIAALVTAAAIAPSDVSSAGSASFTFANSTQNTDSYVITYTTVVTDAYFDAVMSKQTSDSQTYDFQNNAVLHASIYGTDISPSDSDGVTASAKALSKTGTYDATKKVIHWTTCFNLTGLDLDSSKTYALQDTLSNASFEIIPGTEKVYAIDLSDINADGSYAVSDGTLLLNGSESVLASALLDGKYKGFTWTIPTEYLGKALIITYDTGITSDISDMTSLKNNVKLLCGGTDAGLTTGDKSSDASGSLTLADYATACGLPYVKIVKQSGNSDSSVPLVLSDATYQIKPVAVFHADTGTVTNLDYDTIRSNTTNVGGYAYYSGIYYGWVYEVTETQAPAGYVKSDHAQYFIFLKEAEASADTTVLTDLYGTGKTVGSRTSDGMTVKTTSNRLQLSFVDAVDDIHISFVKMGLSETNTTGVVAGANYKLTYLSGSNSGKVKTFTAVSNAFGIVTFENVDPGTYSLQETSVSDKWGVDQHIYTVVVNTDKSFTITQSSGSGDGTITGDNQAGYIITDAVAKGTLTVHKTDAAVSSVNVKGAVYGLFTDEACTGAAAYTATTGTNGVATFSNVPYGNYWLRETTAAAGYQISNEVQAVTTTDLLDKITADASYATTAKTFTYTFDAVTDVRVTTNLMLNKTFAANCVSALRENNNSQVTFKITYLTNAYGTADGYKPFTNETGTAVNNTTVTTDAASGMAVLGNLPYGRYSITEVMPATGYCKNPGTFYLELADYYTSGILNAAVTKSINNTLATGSFTITKQDASSGLPLGGVTYTLTSSSGNNLSYSQVTNASGVASFTGIPAGTYTLKETANAVGYDPGACSVEYAVTITTASGASTAATAIADASGMITKTAANTFVMTNTPITGTLTFLKKTDDGKTLSGAVFTLRDTDNTAKSYTATSDANGRVTFSDIPFSNYQLTETSAPDGYDTCSAVTISKSYLTSAAGLTAASTSFTVEYSEQTDTLVRGTVTVNKEDDAGNALTGAAFTIYDKNTDEAVAYLTDLDGDGMYTLATTNGTTDLSGRTNLLYLDAPYIKGNELAYGVYYLSETTTPEGYYRDEDTDGNLNRYEFGITMGGDAATYHNQYSYAFSDGNNAITVCNAPEQGSFINSKVLTGFQIQKTDAGNGEPLAGVIYTLKGTSSLDGSVYTAISAATDATGMTSFEDVPAGSYTLSESVVPKSYTKMEDRIVTITKDGQNKAKIVITDTSGHSLLNTASANALLNTTGSNVLFSVEDAPVTANLVLEKSFAGNPAYYSLQGVTFKVTYTGDRNYLPFTDKDGTATDSCTVKTDANGKAVLADVPYGSYQIEEVLPQSGYYTGQVANISEDAFYKEGQPVSEIVCPIENQLATGAVLSLIKKDSLTGKTLYGATFSLTDLDGNTQLVTTDAEGKASFSSLAAGEYTLRETGNPAGYQKSDVSYSVSVKMISDGGTSVLSVSMLDEKGNQVVKDGSSYVLKNSPITGTIVLHKTDEAGNALIGAVFRSKAIGILDSMTALYGSGTAASASDGTVTFTNVPLMDYQFSESSAPSSHYTVSAAAVSITADDIREQCHITSDSSTFVYDVGTTFINQAKRGTFSIIKKDPDGTKLTGAAFHLYAQDNTLLAGLTDADGDGTYTISDIYGADAKSTEGSKYIIGSGANTAFLYGDYYVTEVQTPTGYLADFDSSGALVKHKVTIGTAENTVTLVNKKAYADFALVKTDGIRGTRLSGVSFTLSGVRDYDGAGIGSQTLTTDQNGYIKITNLPVGTYTLTESIPEGYKATADYTIRVTQDAANKVSVTMILNSSVPITLQPDTTLQFGQLVTYNIVNTPYTQDVMGTVLTTEGKKLANIKMGLFLAGTTDFSEKNVYLNKIAYTDADGRFLFQDVPPGNYVIAQITGYKNYVKVTSRLSVTVSAQSGQDVSLIFYNTPPSSELGTETENGTSDPVGTSVEADKSTEETISAVKTGDDSPLLLWTLVAATATLVMGIELLKRKRNND